MLEQAPADVSQPGAVTVPAHILHDIVRKLPDGAQVEIKRDAEKERLTLTSGQSRFTLQTLAPEDFPDLAAGRAQPQVRDRRQRPEAPDRQDALCHLHRGDALLPQRHLSAPGHAAARQATLRAVATDGHRLAQAELPLPKGADGHAGHHPAAQDRARAAPPDRRQRGHRAASASRRPRRASRSAPSRSPPS